MVADRLHGGLRLHSEQPLRLGFRRWRGPPRPRSPCCHLVLPLLDSRKLAGRVGPNYLLRERSLLVYKVQLDLEAHRLVVHHGKTMAFDHASVYVKVASGWDVTSI